MLQGNIFGTSGDSLTISIRTLPVSILLRDSLWNSGGGHGIEIVGGPNAAGQYLWYMQGYTDTSGTFA